MLNITYWSDYACPYCYIGETRLKRAIESLGLADKVTYTMKAFRLDPNAGQTMETDTLSRFAQKYRISVAAGQQIDTISQMGRAERLEFNYAQTRFTNTMDAHRLTKYAMLHLDSQSVEKLKVLIFDAYFGKNLELANHDVLLDIAEKVGLDKEEVEQFLLSDEFSEEVISDQLLAQQKGITGVPYFEIGNIAIPGAMPVENFKEILQKELMKLDEVEKTNLSSCDPTGCKL